MIVRSFALLVLRSTVTMPGPSRQPAEAAARFELAPDDVLLDEAIPIVVSGLTPDAAVTVRLRGGPNDLWTSKDFRRVPN